MDDAQGRWACVQVPAGENQGEVRQVGDSGERESIEYMVRHSVQVQLSSSKSTTPVSYCSNYMY